MFTYRVMPSVLATVLLVSACGGSEPAAPDEAAPPEAAPTEVTSEVAAVETTAPPATSTEDTGAPGPTAPVTPTPSATMGQMEEMVDDFGEPADPADADRVIDVEVDNRFEFRPDQFEVAAGEVVTFAITNVGDLEHEFVLGDENAQQTMERLMAGGDGHAHSGDMSNAVTIHAGETAELTWRFTTPGVVLVGCHVPGHWDAGMRGSVLVE